MSDQLPQQSRGVIPAEAIDVRWTHGMNGWRCTAWLGGQLTVEGEITGYEDGKIWMVADGVDRPICLDWEQVRPA